MGSDNGENFEAAHGRRDLHSDMDGFSSALPGDSFRSAQQEPASQSGGSPRPALPTDRQRKVIGRFTDALKATDYDFCVLDHRTLGRSRCHRRSVNHRRNGAANEDL